MTKTTNSAKVTTRLLFVGAAGGREQKVVKVERGVASVARLAEGIRSIRVGGDRAVSAAEVGSHHFFGRRESWDTTAEKAGRGIVTFNEGA